MLTYKDGVPVPWEPTSKNKDNRQFHKASGKFNVNFHFIKQACTSRTSCTLSWKLCPYTFWHGSSIMKWKNLCFTSRIGRPILNLPLMRSLPGLRWSHCRSLSIFSDTTNLDHPDIFKHVRVDFKIWFDEEHQRLISKVSHDATAFLILLKCKECFRSF
jgi:hypothetical protein